MKKQKRIIPYILFVMLIVAMVFSVTGCSTAKTDGDSTPPPRLQTETETPKTVIGQGEKVFVFTAVDMDGSFRTFEIHTDEETVGRALIDNGLISGDEGPYGLYVKTVNGITADYDKDKTYWALYINGEYAMTGVDTTPVEENTEYTMKREK